MQELVQTNMLDLSTQASPPSSNPPRQRVSLSLMLPFKGIRGPQGRSGPGSVRALLQSHHLQYLTKRNIGTFEVIRSIFCIYQFQKWSTGCPGGHARPQCLPSLEPIQDHSAHQPWSPCKTTVPTSPGTHAGSHLVISRQFSPICCQSDNSSWANTPKDKYTVAELL